MARWEPGGRDRLERAALELFAEQGFVATTVPQIAGRAGLTTRSFFRHFPDKREVLFGAEENMNGFVKGALAALPSDIDPTHEPFPAVAEALRHNVAARFDGLFDHLRTRRSVIRSDRSLRERELYKHAHLAELVSVTFAELGVEALTAELAGRVTATILDVALDRWLDQPAPVPTLAERIGEVVAALEALLRPTS